VAWDATLLVERLHPREVLRTCFCFPKAQHVEPTTPYSITSWAALKKYSPVRNYLRGPRWTLYEKLSRMKKSKLLAELLSGWRFWGGKTWVAPDCEDSLLCYCMLSRQDSLLSKWCLLDYSQDSAKASWEHRQRTRHRTLLAGTASRVTIKIRETHLWEWRDPNVIQRNLKSPKPKNPKTLRSQET
jgi:hypothetical protein